MGFISKVKKAIDKKVYETVDQHAPESVKQEYKEQRYNAAKKRTLRKKMEMADERAEIKANAAKYKKHGLNDTEAEYMAKQNLAKDRREAAKAEERQQKTTIATSSKKTSKTSKRKTKQPKPQSNKDIKEFQTKADRVADYLTSSKSGSFFDSAYNSGHDVSNKLTNSNKEFDKAFNTKTGKNYFTEDYLK